MAANEFVHADPGSVLTQNEYIASPGSSGGHTLGVNQAVGDLIYASSAGADGIIRRLAIGTSGQYLTVAGGIPAWSSTLAAGDTVITDGAITFTPTPSDTVTMTAATNGAFSLVTVDDGGAAANIQITADGTVDIDSAGVLTLDSGAAINIEPASGSAILLDGTISIDAGVVTGATSITSTAFVGNLTGNVTGNADTATLATTVTATANNSANETVYPTFVDGATSAQGIETDTGLTYNPSTGVLTSTSFTGNVTGDVTGNVSGTAATVTGATQSAIEAVGTLSSLTVSGLITANGGITFADGDDITFTGASGTNDIVLVNGLADALSITDGSSDILTVNTETGTNTVAITGNLTVSGTTTTVDTTTLAVEDSLIALATGNDSNDAIDIGLYGLYDNSGDKYTGLFRDADDEKWKLFKDLQVAPVGTVNTGGAGYAAGTLVANLEGNVTGALTGNADTVTTNANLTGHVTSVGNAATLGSFTSAQLASALTDETGSGGAVFATSPTLVTPALGTPASGVMTNMTGAVTASIVDNAITLDKMAGLARGTIIYGDASGNPAALASGDAGEVLTMTDGNDFDWAAAAGGGSTTDFTANGAISNGNFLSLNSDGHVEPMVSEVTANPVVFDTHGSPGDSVYDVTNDRLFHAYSDGDDSSKGKCVIGNMSGGAITFGDPVEFEAGNTSQIQVVHDLHVDRFVITYQDGGDSYKGKYVVISVDGSDNITVGTPAVFHASAANSGNYLSWGHSVYDPDAERVAIFFRDTTSWPSDGFAGAIVGEVTGGSTNTMAFGTAEVFASARGCTVNGAWHDPNAERVIALYTPTLVGNDCRAIVAEIDTTDDSFNWGSSYQISTGAFQHPARAAHIPSTANSILAFETSNNGKGSAVLLTVTGGDDNTIVKAGNITVFHDYNDFGHEATGIVWDQNLSKAVITYRSGANSPGQQRGEYVKCTLDGNDVTFSDPLVFDGETNIYWTSPVFDPDSDRILVPHYNADGVCSVINTTVTSNYLNWIGIASAAAANDATCAVNLMGSVNEGQSSLTIGSTYYVNDLGALTATNPLSATASGSREVGRAVAADKLFITQGSIS